MIDVSSLNFNKMDGLIPCVVQDHSTRNVLMLGFMNQEALMKTLEERRVTFYSRTKKKLWTKGETSGNYLNLIDLKIDCDNDTLLVFVKPEGPVCHTGSGTCFGEANKSSSLGFLEEIINHRKNHPQKDSYTNKLLDSGINKVAQKVGEEAVELVIEAKDDNKELFLNEAADLMYHYLVLLAAKNSSMDEVIQVLQQRHSAGK